MGCDGGTIPRRDELVKTKKKPEQKDKTSERAFRWKHCAITQQPLQQPIVACELGRVYSKEAVLETLLNKAEGTPDVAAHIRTLKDVKELKLTENPSWTQESSSNAEVGDAYIDSQKSQWVCPVSAQEMNGTFKFCFIWTCGCVLSDKAMKEIRKAGESSECLRCQKPFIFDDVIIMNPTEEEEQTKQVEKMNARRLLAKKSKKSVKKIETQASATTSLVKSNSPTSTFVKSETNGSDADQPGPSKPNGKVSPPNVSKRPNGEADVPAKKSKLTGSQPGSSKSSKDDKTGSKLSKYSVAKDPKASETYKSLFTSHETAQNQQKAHWVTYNPFYN